MSSTTEGDLADRGTAGYPYGPYLRQMLANPLNGNDTIDVIADDGELPDAGDNSHGWIYKPAELLFKADSPDTDVYGKAYFEY